MIPQYVIDEIISQSNIVEVIGEHIKLKRNGTEHVGLCPFHDEKSPSFSVSPQKRMYKCFGCGKGGNVITFLLEHRKMAFLDVIKTLAEKAGVIYDEGPKKEYKKPVWKNKTALSDKLVKWFEKVRGINQETLEFFQISEGLEWMPQVEKEVPTMQFPYFDGNEVINVKFRDNEKRFKLSTGAKLIPFNLNAIKGSKRAIWCEGEIDCMSFHQAGIREVVSVPNGAGSGKINLEYLDNTIEHFLDKEEIIIATDDDAPGRALREALAIRFGKGKCKYVTFRGFKDANDLLKAQGIQSLIDCVTDRFDFPLEGVYTIKQYGQEIDDIYHYGLPKGAKTQMKNLNKLVEFHKGYYSVITGIPGMGKSDYVDQITLDLSLTSGWKGAFYSPENKPTSLHITKLARKLVGKPWWGDGRITKSEIEEAKDYLNDRFFFVQPKKDFTLDTILDHFSDLILRKGIDFGVIDAWNKLEHKYKTDENKYIGESLDKIDRFCGTNQFHLFIVAHPHKMPKEKGSRNRYEVPGLYNINGSANWFSKPDIGICIHRDYDDDTSRVYVQKVKFSHWGETGVCEFKYDKGSGRFNEYNGGVPVYDNTPWIHSVKGDYSSEVKDQAEGSGITVDDGSPHVF